MELDRLVNILDRISKLDAGKIEKILSILEDVREKTEENKKKYLNLKEASVYLGINKNTMYKYTHYNVIPYYKPNNKVYFLIDDLEKWISKNRVSSQEEIEEKAQEYLNK
jgi:excisionase family DNA binding protein